MYKKSSICNYCVHEQKIRLKGKLLCSVLHPFVSEALPMMGAKVLK